MLEKNKIYCGDCVEVVQEIENESIDLVVTSPPYNVDLGNNKYNKNSYDLYNDNKEHKEYIQWLKSIFSIIYQKLVVSGRVCVNIGDGKNGAVASSSDIIQFMVDLKYIPMTHIVWLKSQIGSRTAWGSFNSPSSPSFPTPFEHILVFCKETKKLQNKGKTDLIKQEFIDWSLALWKFAPENRQKKFQHSAMFPEELPKRCIKMFSWVGATVLDPFSGLGTTAFVAKSLNRNFIGIEMSENYCKLSVDRIGLDGYEKFIKTRRIKER